MGMTLKGGAPRQRSVSENIKDNKDDPMFKMTDGHFGTKNSNSNNVYVIERDNPIEAAKTFYDKIGYGGKFMEGGGENRVQMLDGTIINFRISSKSGSPAVDINVKYRNEKGKLKTHKLHFIKRSK